MFVLLTFLTSWSRCLWYSLIDILTETRQFHTYGSITASWKIDSEEKKMNMFFFVISTEKVISVL